MDNEIRWTAQAYKENEKHPDWYWTIGVIALIIVVLAIVYDNYFFAILILIGGFSTIYFSIKHPPLLDITVSDTGVLVQGHFYANKDIKTFYVNREEGELYIILNRSLLNRVSVFLSDAPAEQIHNILIQNIEEKEEKKSEMDMILDRLGF